MNTSSLPSSPDNERQATDSSESQKDTGFLLPGKRKREEKAMVKFQVLTPATQAAPCVLCVDTWGGLTVLRSHFFLFEGHLHDGGKLRAT